MSYLGEWIHIHLPEHTRTHARTHAHTGSQSHNWGDDLLCQSLVWFHWTDKIGTGVSCLTAVGDREHCGDKEDADKYNHLQTNTTVETLENWRILLLLLEKSWTPQIWFQPLVFQMRKLRHWVLNISSDGSFRQQVVSSALRPLSVELLLWLQRCHLHWLC